MPNQKISELDENAQLFSDCVLGLTEETTYVSSILQSHSISSLSFSDLDLGDDNAIPPLESDVSAEIDIDDDILLLGAKQNESNHKIKFNKLKSSIVDYSMHVQKNQTIVGKKTFQDTCNVSGVNEINSISLKDYINSPESISSHAIFEEEKIIFNVDEELSFISNSEKNSYFSNQGCLNINSNTNEGSISANGDLYTDSLSIKKQNGEYTSTQEDENICFVQTLESNINQKTIYLPKTFKYKPIISATLFNENTSSKHIFYISNVTEYSFDIRFIAQLDSDDYHVHISAFSPSFLIDGSVNPVSDATLIQRFSTPIQGSADSHTITFPIAYKKKPSVHVNIESLSDIIPYRISSVNKQSYNIIFDENIDESYTIHTLSQSPA